MADPTKPQKVTANGKDSWWFFPTCADLDVPTALEINSASGLNVSCYLLAEQDGVTSNAEKVKLARLLCETSTTEGLGEQTWSLADMVIVFDPQADDTDDSKLAFEKFRAAGSGYLARRQGVVALGNKAVVAGQYVDVFAVDHGIATPGKTATDASGIYSATVPVAMRDKAFNKAVV